MSKKEESAKTVAKLSNIFRCPICHQSMEVIDFKSIICPNNHTFDFAKQGYINMYTQHIQQQYSNTLFEARRKLIMESNLYSNIHEIISEKITKHMDYIEQAIVLDAGSGEGSHLHKIINEPQNHKMLTGIGLDISKEGILMAAKNYAEPTWLVGDLANIPLADQTIHVLLNILSPANYQEFKRILAPEGLIIKIIPRANYLQELRTEILAEDKRDYSNKQTEDLFKEQFHLLEQFSFTQFKKLEQDELENLTQMSPLTWRANEKQLKTFLKKANGVTIDLEILIGKKTSL